MPWALQLLIGCLTDFILTAGAFLTGGNVATGQSVLTLPSRAMIFYAVVAGLMGAAKHLNGMMVEGRGPSSLSPAVLRSLLLLVIGVALMSGCATVQRVETDLSKATTEDLDVAIAMAAAANPVVDPGAAYRARCYVTLKKYVPAGQTVGQALLPKGIVSTVELAMELDARLRSGVGVPPDVHADCAVLSINLVEFAGRVGLKLAPIPGAGALPSLPILR